MTKGVTPLMLTSTQVAGLLNINQKTTYELINTGVIPSVDIGGITRIPSEELSKRFGLSMESISESMRRAGVRDEQ